MQVVDDDDQFIDFLNNGAKANFESSHDKIVQEAFDLEEFVGNDGQQRVQIFDNDGGKYSPPHQRQSFDQQSQSDANYQCAAALQKTTA